MSNVITEIIRNHFPDFEKGHKIPKYKIKTMQKITDCRTSKLGGHVKKCTNPDCGTIEVWYNSCKNRSCPTCSYTYKQRWLERQEQKILNVKHYHVVFTIPDELNELWNNHPRVMANILFASASESMDILLKDSKYLGASAGKIMSLHTWGSNLTLHPHVHCLVSAGGLDKHGKWKNPVHENYLFPVKALSILFRSNLLKRLKTEIRPSGKMAFDNDADKEACKALIQKLFQKKWNVFINKNDSKSGNTNNTGNNILMYIANYIKGGAIGASRIVQYKAGKNGFVRFKYKDYKNSNPGERAKKSVMKLSVNDFIQRLILHIPPVRSHTVRYSGLYSPNSIKKLNQSRKLLDQKEIDIINLNSKTDTEREPCLCKRCKSDMNIYFYQKDEIIKFVENTKNDPNLKNKLVEYP